MEKEIGEIYILKFQFRSTFVISALRMLDAWQTSSPELPTVQKLQISVAFDTDHGRKPDEKVDYLERALPNNDNKAATIAHLMRRKNFDKIDALCQMLATSNTALEHLDISSLSPLSCPFSDFCRIPTGGCNIARGESTQILHVPEEDQPSKFRGAINCVIAGRQAWLRLGRSTQRSNAWICLTT